MIDNKKESNVVEMQSEEISPVFNTDVIRDDYKKYYEIVEKIGKGAYADIYKTKDKKTNELKAIKIIDFEYFNIEEEEEDILKLINNEVKNMQICGFKNKNSVKIYQCFYLERQFSIIMECCDCTLYDILKHKKEGFNADEIYNILCQLNNTFRKLKENNIVHRDIKLENILVKYEDNQKNFTLKLADYGISKILTNSTTVCETHCGTINIMAPEILEGDKEYDYKCDLWSIGVIIYQLLFKDLPYKGPSEIAIYNKIKKYGPKVLKPSNNEELNDLILKLLVYEPKKRLTWEEYFNHPFFKKN